MNCRLVRTAGASETETQGILYYGPEASCKTLELPWKDNAKDVSCIPYGTYVLEIVKSPRFGRLMPRLIGVPSRSNILVHPLNTVAQTEGCIGVGEAWINGNLLNAEQAFDEFFVWLSSELAIDPPSIEITYSSPQIITQEA